jgi:photosystem I P700 chlorophyll a apoprotein A2
VDGIPQGSGTAILTLLGGFHPQTQSLWLTDLAHHHLAIAIRFLMAGHMYRTNFGSGRSIQELLEAHLPPGGRLGRGPNGLYYTNKKKIKFKISHDKSTKRVINSMVSQQKYTLTA